MTAFDSSKIVQFTGASYRLTVRIVFRRPFPAQMREEGGYRWNRICGAAALLVITAFAVNWLVQPGQLSPDTPAATSGARITSAALEPGVEDSERTPPEGSVVGESNDLAVDDSPWPLHEGDALAPVQVTDEIVTSPATPGSSGGAADRDPSRDDSTLEWRERSPAGENDVTSSGQRSPLVRNMQETGDVGDGSGAASRSQVLANERTSILSDRVNRFLLTDAVRNREPVGSAAEIREDREVKGLIRVIAYSEVKDLAGQTLRYRWLLGEKLVADIRVTVGSNTWRSYSSKFLNRHMRGAWRVELQTADGDLLAVTEFEY